MIIDWESVADWVSGLGSLAAAVVALYVAVYSQRVKLRGYCRHGTVVEKGKPPVDVIAISATNISMRPTKVLGIYLSCWIWPRKRYLYVKFASIPMQLSDGETGDWHIPRGETNKWARGLVDKLEMTRWSVPTLRVQIHTSNGGTTVIRPDKEFRDTLMALVEEKKKA